MNGESCASFRFTCSLLSGYVQESLGRFISVIDLVGLTSWSPVWSSPGMEPAAPLVDLIVYLRVVLVNLVVSFKKSSGIWPDILVLAVCVFSLLVLYDLILSYLLYNVSSMVIVAEFAAVFWSPDRRRQRKLWKHNATFRISQFTRNPFQRSIRRSLLLPLINRRHVPEVLRNEEPSTPPPPVLNVEESQPLDTNTTLHMNEGLISSFLDIVPPARGHNAERRILHLHCVHSQPCETAKALVVFLHQFGSGAFTWQSVMAELAQGGQMHLLAYDRVAHGLTFASEPLVESRDSVNDTTPLSEDLSLVSHFSDIVNRPGYEVELLSHVISSTAGSLDRPVILVVAGGTGARLAVDFATRNPYVSKLVFVSPYMLQTGGISSVLRSVVAAQVGRALVVSMAKSEVTDVIPRRSWLSHQIPESVLEAYRKAVEVPGWGDAMLNLLKRPVPELPTLPDSVSRIPALLISGQVDHFTTSPSEYSDFAARFSNMCSVCVHGSGASPQEEDPQTVAQLIYQFVLSS